MQSLACKYHPHGELIEDWRAGDVICRECGRVVGERMLDVSSEWRDFGSESDSISRSRVGAAQNLLYDNGNLETMVPAGIVTKRSDEFKPARRSIASSQISSSEKALREARSALQGVASRMDLTKRVIDRAYSIYKICYEKKYLRGRSQEINVATCIYMACREEGSTRTFDEIAGNSSASSKEISRNHQKLVRLLPKSATPKFFNIADVIPRFCEPLELSQPILIRKTAIHIAERAKEICDVQGRKPSSIAGASIYLACLAARENVSKRDINQSTGASEIVIREVYQIMLPHTARLFPADFVFKCPIANLPSA